MSYTHIARWAPILVVNGVISYNPYKWPYEWVTEVIIPTSGVITLLETGDGAHFVF